MDAEGDAHQHLLRALSNLAVDLQEITPFECLKNEIIELLISILIIQISRKRQSEP